jgi:hypothetical protein
MNIAPLHRHFSQAHLDHVIGEMVRRGAPRLRGYRDVTAGCWLLAEWDVA